MLNSEPKEISIFTSIYPTVDKEGCRVARLNSDFFFCFTITICHPALNAPQYSQYQFFLYQTITEQREKGKTFDQIAEWLNNKGYLFVRGKKFKGNHVHSIVKKKRLKDEKLEKEYPEVRSDFHLDILIRLSLICLKIFKNSIIILLM